MGPVSARPEGAAELALELRGITKRFGPVVANDGVDLQLRRGEIHALLGENGAGKSTLMNVVYGMTRPDAGRVLVDGEMVSVDTRVRHVQPEPDGRRYLIGLEFQAVPTTVIASIEQLAASEEIEVFHSATSEP